MIRDFGIVWSERSLLLSGLANTTILSVLSAIAALVLGMALTPALMARNRSIAFMARGFVDGMRCVPFLLFAYIVYYGLPSLGLRFDNWTSGLIALIVYNTPPIWPRSCAAPGSGAAARADRGRRRIRLPGASVVPPRIVSCRRCC